MKTLPGDVVTFRDHRGRDVTATVVASLGPYCDVETRFTLGELLEMVDEQNIHYWLPTESVTQVSCGSVDR